MSETRIDSRLFWPMAVLVAVGIAFVCSASYPRAAGDAARLAVMWRQAMWAGIGLTALVTTLFVPYNLLRSPGFVWLVAALSAGLLVVVLLPGVGTSHGRGTDRWLLLGPLSVQPSETAKFALCFVLALLCSMHRGRLREPDVFVPIFSMIGLVCVMVLKQPHLGATMVIAATSLLVLYVAGARRQHLGLVVLLGCLLAAWSLSRHPYQMARVTSWLHPEQADASDDAYQAVHCATALARGGPFGRGPGHSIEKFDYLPECFTDSILAVLGEETGLIGTVGVLLLFGLLAWRGFAVAVQLAEHGDWFGCYLATGLTTVIYLQAMLNYWVTTGLMPQTGVGLPFISYGGSALCCFMAAVGVLLNLSRQVPPAAAAGSQSL